MAPSPQSRFIEGSMNDRTSNAPPPGYLGPDAVGTPEFERQFALDWKAPDLNTPPPPTRTSFISIGSVTSTAPTSPRSGSGSAWSRGHKSTGSSATGFLAPLWDGVKERFSLQRSKSSNTITGLFVLPTFKQKRSESASTTTVLADDSSRQRDSTSSNQESETPKLKKAQSAAALTAGATNGHTAFDPTKRPTREEIQASYQNLVASGFFGNRAIQSTRFSPPGQNRSNTPFNPDSPSIAHRMAEGGQEQWKTISQPLPRRQPPPPPPITIPPGRPGLPTDITSISSSSAGIPETAIYKPVPESTQASKDMPPPPSPPKQRTTRHKPSLSLSSVPYSSDHPDDAATPKRPFRRPPLSHGRFSFDARRSLDALNNDGPDHQKGMKRPFTAFNLSNVSVTGGTYHDIVQGVDREKETQTSRTSAESARESGALKLAKKLRKSASRLSMDLMSRPGSTVNDESEADNSGVSTPTRQPLSAAIRRSFSWRLGKPGPATTSPEPNEKQKRRNSKIWSGIGNVRGGREAVGAAPDTPRTGSFLPPSLFPAQPRLSAEANSAAQTGTDCMEGLEFMVSSSHLQSRALAVVPDANRGIPSVPSIPGEYRGAKMIANGRGENSIDAMVIDGVGGGGAGAWSSSQALF
ncbi:hypothetical protein VPNG_01133 [Cytospora leucostoma]|uniref:Uncharacterized protein n=1 Tax=Cytospora leucostoma TaxID=1230097 RepID=A0A423XKM1_9PEZI|nr:hypothetical protein VPNG_01133 [Cytospora leucostoma]